MMIMESVKFIKCKIKVELMEIFMDTMDKYVDGDWYIDDKNNFSEWGSYGNRVIKTSRSCEA